MKTFFETDILLDNRLGKNDIKVLLVLSAHANQQGICWPSRNRIAEMSGIHIGNITNILNRVRDYGYIEIQPSSGHSNRYKMIFMGPKAETVESDKENQEIDEPNAEGLLDSNKGADQGLLEITKGEDQGLLDSNKGGLLDSNKGGLLDSNKHNYKENYKENYINKNNEKSVPQSYDWKRMTFSKFKGLKTRPDFSEEFISIWKRYRKACSELDSENGNRLHAFFRYLILQEHGFRHEDIVVSIRRYVETKRKSGYSMAHLSTFLNDPDLVRQHFEDENDANDNKPKETVEVEIPDFSARFDLSTPTSNSGKDHIGRANNPRVDIDASPSRLEPVGIRD